MFPKMVNEYHILRQLSVATWIRFFLREDKFEKTYGVYDKLLLGNMTSV